VHDLRALGVRTQPERQVGNSLGDDLRNLQPTSEELVQPDELAPAVGRDLLEHRAVDPEGRDAPVGADPVRPQLAQPPALSASRARIIPPSPVRSTLLWLKLKQPKSPIAPANESPIAETVGMGVVLDHRCSGLGGDLHDRVHVDGERLNSSSSASPTVSQTTSLFVTVVSFRGSR
jgi:hypothetical protein